MDTILAGSTSWTMRSDGLAWDASQAICACPPATPCSRHPSLKLGCKATDLCLASQLHYNSWDAFTSSMYLERQMQLFRLPWERRISYAPNNRNWLAVPVGLRERRASGGDGSQFSIQTASLGLQSYHLLKGTWNSGW